MAEPRAVEPARFLWAASAAALVVLAAYGSLVLTSAGQAFENLALLGAREEFAELREESLAELHAVSLVSFALAVAVVMLIALVRRKPVLALTAALVMAVSVVLAEAAKLLLVRPELVDAPPRWLSNSFPSGHVAVAVALGVGAVLVVPYVLRPVTTVGAALFAMGVAQAVGIAGWHRLSGVVGAAFLVLAVAALALYGLGRAGRVSRLSSPRRVGFTAVVLSLGGLAAVLGGTGLLFGLARVLPVPDSPSGEELRLAYTTTLVLGAAAIAVVFVVLLWLIRPFALDEDPDAGRPQVREAHPPPVPSD